MTPGWWRSFISRPDVVKMPAPIMLAMTMLVSGKRPSLRSRPFAGARGVTFCSFFTGHRFAAPAEVLL